MGNSANSIGKLDDEILMIIHNNPCISVSDLISNLSRKYNLPDYLIAYKVWLLWKKGLINLSAFNTQSSAAQYLFSIESLWFWISLAITYIAFASIYVNNLVINFIRYFVGAIFITFVLGYAVVEFVYPKGDEVSPLERFVLSLGLSITIIPIVGVILSYMPFKYTVYSVSAALTILASIMLILALARKASIYMNIGKWCESNG
ncbi:hypothetical protein VMUT_1040 [Vulcanisaeta moutnovskia 768-28]|uniref:DUF1616 domain-containing protein n=1 Tax=Vulcanisaeta moutnovskia (strain 768-28) TaxID=985053 RepID=F0QXT4_VULM7|nr:DUF1616 domain-containing protein [Vulcanisaeta moutnovskia]ADY01247.1 hypothetical protein VMUT_1040 [Vulcanisaeta moutnovskia 768-28]